ncbi:site-specific integrase [Mucilaginibacter sp. UR6-11]|uniref:tyrosine-type recombinase/integrase n=1 Tax=Mucilaginibacter sp. UR6-11 TaxID=1435644 RepID=UPI001E36EE7C|nr:site-specific integrase [Mucilaginibacter sp. UR6-11]MCC8426587.1 site-specific integrase [Mucilaginibacter sp. UR6-11]
MSTLRFALRSDKVDKSGKCPIELIYQIAGQRKKIFLEKDGKLIKLNYINWSIETQTAVYVAYPKAKKLLYANIEFANILQSRGIQGIAILESEADGINSVIAGTRLQIANIEKLFELNKQKYSDEDVINKFKEAKTGVTKKTEHRELLFDFMDKYITDHEPRRAKGSLSVYKSVKTHLQNYQNSTGDKVRFESINKAFFERFQSFLISDGKLNNTTIAKVLSTLKTFLSYAEENDILVNGNYRKFQIKREKLEVIALTNDEFTALLEKDFTENKKFDRVRDIFCFSCATGLRVSDLIQLKREHIKKDEIKLTVKKTKTELIIPLNKISAGILDKYKDQAKPLPMISSPKLNEYIKEACEAAGIDDQIEIVRFRGANRETTIYPKYKLIRIHTGRKTFVTLSLEKGMSAEQVMAITGHSDYSSFKRYVDITKKLSKVVMAKAWGEVNHLKAV